SVLGLRMLVVLGAWVFDIGLAAVLNAGRFDLGFYAGRVYGLVASSLVLLVLLLENGTLYARLAAALQGERIQRERAEDKTSELNALNESLQRHVAMRTAQLDVMNVELEAEVSERERAEVDALQARERPAGIIDSARDAIVTVDERQRIILFNTAAEALFGWTQGEVIGRPLDVLIPLHFRTAHGRHIKRFGEGGVTSRRMG